MANYRYVLAPDARQIQLTWTLLFRIEATALVGVQRFPQDPFRRETLRQVSRLIANFASRLDALAARTAVNADKRIQEVFDKTAKRPHTGIAGVHLRDSFKSRPINTPVPAAAVGIADIDELNKARNPAGRGSRGQAPYWRAQEYGLDHRGRKIHGFFFGPGMSGPERPDPGQRAPIGQQPIFRAGPGGPGTIREPIKARHFLEKGERQAEATWRQGLKTILAGIERDVIRIQTRIALGLTPGGGRRRR